MTSNQTCTYTSSGEVSLSEKISELFQNETASYEGKWLRVRGVWGYPTSLFSLFSHYPSSLLSIGNTNEESAPLALSEGEPLLKKSAPEEAPKKRRRRRKAHRLSNSERAKKAREKKKLYYHDLENKVAYLTELCETLKQENAQMKSQLSQLQKTETNEKPCYDTQKKRDSKSYDKSSETHSKE